MGFRLFKEQYHTTTITYFIFLYYYIQFIRHNITIINIFRYYGEGERGDTSYRKYSKHCPTNY